MNVRIHYIGTTVLLAALAAGYLVTQQEWRRPAPTIPSRVERSAAARPAPPPPMARDLLARGDELRLTADQRARLETLDRAWKQDSGGLESAVADASRRFSAWMAEAQAKGRVSMDEIQRQSEDLRSLSASLRERRRLHGEAVTQLLTTAQRATLGLPLAPTTSGGNR